MGDQVLQSGPELNDPRQSRFQHAPLASPREIRLLELLDGPEDAVLSCRITSMSLDDRPNYAAISYVWGDHNQQEAILINGTSFGITANCAATLRCVRRYYKSTYDQTLPQLIWIDAICINQADFEERDVQVPLMPTVYGSAEYVFSWIGAGLETVEAGFRFIKTTVRASQESHGSTRMRQRLDGTDEAALIASQSQVWPDDGVAVDTQVDPRLMHLFSMSTGISTFFSLPYWQRAWVVQELVLSKPEKNILFYADDSMTARDVQVFRDSWLTFLKELQLIPDWESIASTTPGWGDISESWPEYVRQMETSLVLWSYYDFLRGVRLSGDNLFYIILATAYQATDPHDKVYSLISLVEQPRIVPDYHSSIKDVYTNWFRIVLDDWQSMEALYFSGLCQSSAQWNLPTWVPDLSMTRRDSPVWDATLARGIGSEPAGYQNLQFGNDGNPVFRIHGSSILQTRGAFLGSVTKAIPLGSTPAEAADRLALVCRRYATAHGSTQYQTGIPVLRALFRALMCGVNRFASSSHGRPFTNIADGSSDNATSALTTRDYQVAAGSDRYQLVESMPLLQAVAKILARQGRFSPLGTDDSVLQALCRPSTPLGTDVQADLRLSAAFMALLLSGRSGEEMARLLRDLGLRPGPGMVQSFLDCFVNDTARGDGLRGDEIPDDLLQDPAIVLLSGTLQRYLQAYEHTLFLTTDGLVGNGPAPMMAGDRVVVFDGVKLPFLVRKVEGGYQLVGPCYVEGASNGEPAAMARLGQVEVEDVHLV